MSTNGTAGARLKSFVASIERLEDDKADIAVDIKAVYAEAKAEGFDAKVIRKIIARRKDPAKTREQDELVELYEAAIGSPKRDPRQIDIEEHIAGKTAIERAEELVEMGVLERGERVDA